MKMRMKQILPRVDMRCCPGADFIYLTKKLPTTREGILNILILAKWFKSGGKIVTLRRPLASKLEVYFARHTKNLTDYSGQKSNSKLAINHL